MKLKEFDYILPKELIAQAPLKQRDASRLMVLHRESKTIEHTYFHCLPSYIQMGDMLVANDTRVIPARIYGKKETGGWVELFLLKFRENVSDNSQTWECLIKNLGKTNKYSKLFFSPVLSGTIMDFFGNGRCRVRLDCRGNFDEAIKETGKTPLPPYIKRDRAGSDDELDRERYQTVYAAKDGAVAAPTAGMHFTGELIDSIKSRGADFSYLTLHVGYGTFQPIREQEIEKHRIHEESFCVGQAVAEKINTARRCRGRIVSVGTTATRVLETMTDDDGQLHGGEGDTDIYIYPGYLFKSVDALITNFHLPESSLLLLVSAFAGREFILKAYEEAVKKKYRFFSYGDAMLIL